MNIDRTKTIEDLEDDRWDAPPYSSHVVTETYRLRKIPLDRFTTEDLRFMIGQSRALPYLVPMALEILIEDPWAAGDFGRGDLLRSVMRVEPDFWRTHDDLVSTLVQIFGDLTAALDLLQTEVLPAWSALYQTLYKADPP